MFNKDFYPTPSEVISLMLEGFNLEGKVILEPSAGKGNIVDFCKSKGATVIACEKNDDLRTIVASKCKVIATDFLDVKSEDVSHINMIVMNPPFSADERHITHAWEIAPDGCHIIALCNLNTIKERATIRRKELGSIVDIYGSWQDIGSVFADAERTTDVGIGLIKLHKPSGNYDAEFEGFFMEDDPEEEQVNGLMQYNVVRDLVNRYIGAVKLFDQQIELGVQMNYLLKPFYGSKIGFQCTEEGKPKLRSEFKKDAQKAAWQYIFKELNMEKYATKGLREDINKFVEQQTAVPFTMRNVYQMLRIIAGTHSQRMDKALLEVFDKVTMHYHENRYNVEGWKTNSHYLLTEKFIMPHSVVFQYGKLRANLYGWADPIEDLHRALCYMTGESYEIEQEDSYGRKITIANTFSNFLHNNKCLTNQWYSWGFFEFKGFKKQTVHFRFKDKDVWARFNQNIARIKGYPLYEAANK